jgi:hypothetical protein
MVDHLLAVNKMHKLNDLNNEVLETDKYEKAPNLRIEVNRAGCSQVRQWRLPKGGGVPLGLSDLQVGAKLHLGTGWVHLMVLKSLA